MRIAHCSHSIVDSKENGKNNNDFVMLNTQQPKKGRTKSKYKYKRDPHNIAFFYKDIELNCVVCIYVTANVENRDNFMIC